MKRVIVFVFLLFFNFVAIIAQEGETYYSLEDALENKDNVYILDLSNQELIEIPESIGDLIKIESLNLSRNSLTKLPKSMGNLQKLKFLNISNNKMNNLPEIIISLKSLTLLNLSNNDKFFSPPSTIGSLQKGKILDIYRKVEESPSIHKEVEFVGIGVALKKEGENTKIGKILIDMPAYKSKKLEVGDIILKVAQANEKFQDIRGMDLKVVVGLIRGEKGTIVRLIVNKADNTKVEVSILRQTINTQVETDLLSYSKSLQLINDKLEYEHDNGLPFPIIKYAPVYPNCKGTLTEKKECFKEKVREHIKKEFNFNLFKDLGLELNKKNKVEVQFKFSNKEEVIDIMTNSKHKVLEKEAVRVINSLPKVTPGRYQGVRVSVVYYLTIPF